MRILLDGLLLMLCFASFILFCISSPCHLFCHVLASPYSPMLFLCIASIIYFVLLLYALCVWSPLFFSHPCTPLPPSSSQIPLSSNIILVALFLSQINVHHIPKFYRPCPRPLCQISSFFLKLFWLGLKMVQV